MLASSGHDLLVHLWDVGTGKELRRFAPAQTGWYLDPHLMFSDGKTLSLAHGYFDRRGKRTVRITTWDAVTGEEPHRIDSHSWFLAFSPGGNMFAAIDRGDRKVVRIFSPLANALVPIDSAEDAVLRIWDVSTGKSIWQIEGAEKISSAMFAPDGKTFATGSADNAILIWSVPG